MSDGSSLAAGLAADLMDARRRTLDLVTDLSDEQIVGPRLAIVNPLRWEIGHLAWFQERWLLRELRGEKPIRDDADTLYDSFKVAHETRWDLPLPSRAGTLSYMQEVLDRALVRLNERDPDETTAYFYRMVTGHEDMHAEAFLYGRQTLGYPPPRFLERRGASGTVSPAADRTWPAGAAAPGLPRTDHSVQVELPAGKNEPPRSSSRTLGIEEDAEIAGGAFLLGATRLHAFVWDNEKWAHPVDVRPFRMARSAVTQGAFAQFIDEGGYRRRELWSEAGWSWREAENASCHVYWRKDTGGEWLRRRFDTWVPLETDAAVIHVNYFEAEAFCRWADRRLPTEAEWELAASAEPDRSGGLSPVKRRYPWGDGPPSPATANLEGTTGGTIDTAACEAGDSAFGCRQMIGNVWEWTSSDFLPYPGFVVDPYREYSEPWFGHQKVLRGGCWATRARLIRNTWRNFYTPDRRDVFAGFRTCARSAV